MQHFQMISDSHKPLPFTSTRNKKLLLNLLKAHGNIVIYISSIIICPPLHLNIIGKIRYPTKASPGISYLRMVLIQSSVTVTFKEIKQTYFTSPRAFLWNQCLWKGSQEDLPGGRLSRSSLTGGKESYLLGCQGI